MWGIGAESCESSARCLRRAAEIPETLTVRIEEAAKTKVKPSYAVLSK